jgi:Phage integrase family
MTTFTTRTMTVKTRSFWWVLGADPTSPFRAAAHWIKSLEGHLSASTIKGIAGWVSTIFKTAIYDGIVARNPFDAGSVRRPRVRATKAVPWSWCSRGAGSTDAGELPGGGVPSATRASGVHVLRHTAASAWLAAGVDIRTVAEFLGHSDPGVHATDVHTRDA